MNLLNYVKMRNRLTETNIVVVLGGIVLSPFGEEGDIFSISPNYITNIDFWDRYYLKMKSDIDNGYIELWVGDAEGNGRYITPAEAEQIANLSYNSSVTYEFIFEDTPYETPDGSTTEFTLHSNYITGKLLVFLNGVQQIKDLEYTESLPDKIVFIEPPVSNDVVSVSYQKNQ